MKLSQLMQELCSGVDWYFPGSQNSHFFAASSAYVPALQERHSDFKGSSVNLPAEQFLQVVDPTASEKDPHVQAVH
jgi:hypothetical protein